MKKRILSLFLAVLLLVSGVPVNTKATEIPADVQVYSNEAEEFAASYPSSLYLKQETGGTCTLSSTAMLLRARTYLSRNSGWSKITESAIRSAAWLEGVGLKHNFTYYFGSSRIQVNHAYTDGMSLSALQTLLKSHPEGIVLYCAGRPHAVFVTDCTGNTVYCADPAGYNSGKRIPIASSWLGAGYGTQKAILEHTTSYWYVSSYSIKETGDMVSAPVIKTSSVASTGKIQVSWSAVTGAEKYEIYRSTSKIGTYSLMKTTTATKYTNNNAETGKVYYYKVRAVTDDDIKSDFSNIAERTCDLARPAVKSSIVESTGKIKLTWGKISGAKQYQIYRATSKNGTYKRIKTTTATAYTDTSATAGKTYYYKVRALHSRESANSADSIVVSRTCDLARPDLNIKRNSGGKPYLTWDKVEGAKGYRIYRATSKTGTYKLMKTTTATSYSNNAAVNGKTYYYKIRAIHSNTNAFSDYSVIRSIKSR